jgi:hypothetical protein
MDLHYDFNSPQYHERRAKLLSIKERKEKREQYLLRGKKKSPLETAATTAAIVGFLGAIFFLSPNLTGNVIGSLNQTSSNWVGAVFFIVGLVGAFIYFRKR